MRSIVAVALAAAALISSSCQRSGTVPPPSGRVVVLGVDGLDLRMLDQEVKAGRLPNFSRLYREGAVGPVNTALAGIPPVSPRIWTSFATGQLPGVHAIKSFVYADASGTRRLYSSRQRAAPAAWEIASAAGRRAGVVNWWFTYPAEAINGFVISDRYMENWARRTAKFFDSELEREHEHLVYPPALAQRLPSAVANPNTKAVNPQTAETIDGNIFALVYDALAEHPVDLLMIYTRALDELSHTKWHTHERLPGEPPVADEIAAYLERYDGMLGALLARLDAKDHLFVLSDHGFERRTEGKGLLGVHHSLKSASGVLVLHGPRIRRGFRLKGATLLDVLPTMLELLGVPPARDMPGQVLTGAFRPEHESQLARVAAYERVLPAAADAPEVTEADSDTIERLRQLGYLE